MSNGVRPQTLHSPPVPAWLTDELAQARLVLEKLCQDPQSVATIARVPSELARAVRGGGRILICGNGGSSCDAAHFAEELTGRFRGDRPPIAALACSDAGHVTCTANDYGFEQVFARWVLAMARPGDVLIVLSTSGNSANIVRAVEAARALGGKIEGGKTVGGVTCVALLGKGGGALAGRCDIELCVPGETSDRIQELHMLILHLWCQGLERELGYA
jgi:D-sedoheptulose 7-phosphate isomerase